MNLGKIHHVAIIASDYDRSKHFYVDLLGFEVLRENHRPDRGDVKLDLRMGDCELELFGIPGRPPRPTAPEVCGLRHLAFAVDDVEAATAELESKGVPVEPIRWDPYSQKRFTFFKDPDGLPLELHE